MQKEKNDIMKIDYGMRIEIKIKKVIVLNYYFFNF